MQVVLCLCYFHDLCIINSTKLLCGHFQIIFANVSTKEHDPVSLNDVATPFELQFSYSVKWIQTPCV